MLRLTKRASCGHSASGYPLCLRRFASHLSPFLPLPAELQLAHHLNSDTLIDIEHVTFGYDASRTILNDVSRGSSVAR
jgi:hypothetical protein